MTFRLDQEELFEATIDHEAFAALLARLADAVGARTYVAGWHYPDETATMFHHSLHWSDSEVERYNRDFALIDIWNVAQLKNFRTDRAIDLCTLVSDREFERSLLYNEFFRSIGDDTFRALAVGADNELGRGGLAFHRGRRQAPFTPDEIALLNEYAPQLGRLLALRGRFSALERRASSLEAMLDAAAGPLLLAAGDGALIHANHAAENLLAQGRIVGLVAGQVRALNGVAARRLSGAIAGACCPNQPSSATIALPRGDKLPLLVQISPVRIADGQWRALVAISDPCAADERMAQRLRKLFGLTSAESAVAVQLASGMTLRDIAAERRASVETVRTQVRAIAGKLGCSRQSEIVGMIKSLP